MVLTRCQVTPTKHAKRRCLERGISQERLEEILWHGRKERMGGRKGRHLLGRDGAIAVTVPRHHQIITVYTRD